MNVTMTGVDKWTTINELPVGPEYAVLVSAHPDARPRYPSDAGYLLETLDRAGHPAAAHLCGRVPRTWLEQGLLDGMLASVSRVQVNGIVQLAWLRMIAQRHRGHVWITQGCPENAGLYASGLPNHAILMDSSGGRGIPVSRWTRPSTDQPVGFAGGLGPATIATELPKIAAVARDPWWIDMESSLRDGDDRFDIERAAFVATEVSRYQRRAASVSPDAPETD